MVIDPAFAVFTKQRTTRTVRGINNFVDQWIVFGESCRFRLVGDSREYSSMNFFGSRIDVAPHIAGQLFKTPRDIDGIRKSNVEQTIAAFRTTPATLHVPAILFADLLEPFIYIHGASMPHCSSAVNSPQLVGSWGPSVPEYRGAYPEGRQKKDWPGRFLPGISCHAARRIWPPPPVRPRMRW